MMAASEARSLVFQRAFVGIGMCATRYSDATRERTWAAAWKDTRKLTTRISGTACGGPRVVRPMKQSRYQTRPAQLSLSAEAQALGNRTFLVAQYKQESWIGLQGLSLRLC